MKLFIQPLRPRTSTSMLRPFAAACLVAVACFGWTGWAAAAAVCSSDDYNLNTQAEVDALGRTGCEIIRGYLKIVSSTEIYNLDGLANITFVRLDLSIRSSKHITNLDGLANLTMVFGDLDIYNNDALTNLDGLASLTRVGDSLIIDGNDVLADIDGLASLTSLGDNLSITRNDALTNLDGLGSLTSVRSLNIGYNDVLTNLDGLANITQNNGSLGIHNNDALTDVDGLVSFTRVSSLSIDYNDALRNLDGLANLTSVGDSLHISNNGALTNIDGLASLINVGKATLNSSPIYGLNYGYLYIYSNDALTNIDGLANLASVEGFLGIGPNDALTNLDGLANLTSVGDYLRISDNLALTNLDGLASLTSVGGYLFIRGNRGASCEGVAPLLGWPDGPPDDIVTGDITIEWNGSGCGSIEQVLESVSGPTNPRITSAAAASGGMSLEFSPSTTTDTLFRITGYEAVCFGSSADLNEAPAAALLDNTPVTQTLTVSGYDPVSVLSDIEVDIDITHSDLADLYITLTTPQGTELILWNQGDSGGEDIAGTFPITLTPIDTISSVSRQAMDGDWVLGVEDVDVGPLVREGVLNAWGLRISEIVTATGSGAPITINGVARGRDYSCTVAPLTGLGTQSVSDAVTVNVPSELPTTPEIEGVDYNDGEILIFVSSSNQPTTVDSYNATCTDGSNTFTGTSTSSPIIVSGLTNDVAYTCTVSATNSVGTSSASSETAPIIPELTDGGLPIWLLYEATQ